MNTPTRQHRSTAYVHGLCDRGRARKPDPITPQFRFIVRMAVACHAACIPYDVEWNLEYFARMRATITAAGEIPTPKQLPKPPKLKLVSAWKPTVWDAEYKLDAYHNGPLKRLCPGFVIAHSSGLSLVHPSESGELGVTEHGADEDIRQGWLLTHAASGLGFGLTLSFKRAADALLMAASFPVDWTQDADTLARSPEFKRAGYTVQAAFSSGYDRDTAKERLAELERAA